MRPAVVVVVAAVVACLSVVGVWVRYEMRRNQRAENRWAMTDGSLMCTRGHRCGGVLVTAVYHQSHRRLLMTLPPPFFFTVLLLLPAASRCSKFANLHLGQ